MTKTFCDRCGKEIQMGFRNYSLLTRRVHYSEARLITINPREDWEMDDVYMCKDCEDSYIHWFMNPERPYSTGNG